MKRILFLIFALISGLNSFSQPIVVNTTTYTVPQLVQDVLFAPSSGGSSSCVGTISNITWSTGTNFGSSNGIGYFTNTNPNFPLASGVILSTGNVSSAPGPNGTIQSNGSFAWPGDQDLTDYMSDLGLIDPSVDDYHNASILEFDFVPLTNQMSFDFLFASEEYGTFQCSYSDAFAFFLTNVTTGSPPVNLALVPSTTIPISVTTIRDDDQLPTCGASNVAYFGSNNEGGNAATAAINFNGQTVTMTATSAVIPNNTYHIKLVISDLNDESWDSAVFLGGGSFDIGTADISGTGAEFGGLVDFSGGNAICGSKTVVAQAGSVPIPGATYAWTLGGNPVGTNSYNYTITQAGTYGITITYPGGCQQTDTMVVEYLPSLPLGTPNDLTVCANPFNLTNNTSVILNGVPGPVKYYHTLLEAQQFALTSISPAASYTGSEGEVIYAAVEDDVTGCITTKQFILHIDPSLCGVQPAAVPNLVVCDDASNDGIGTFNFTPQIPIALGTHAAADYTITFHLTQAAADGDTGAIVGITAFNNTSNPQTIYIRMEENANPLTFGTVSFQLIVNTFTNAGGDGNTSVCETSTTPINLFSLITGEQTGGAWTRSTGTGGTFNGAAGTFTPAVGATTSTFTYTVTGVAPCVNDTSVAAVNIVAQPTAGADGGTTVCENSAVAVDLFSLITGEQTGGTWVRTTGTGGTFSAAAGTYTPAVGATTSTFTYTLTGTLPCINDSSIATITINAQPVAGGDGGLIVCETSVTVINLFSLITGEQAGGVWTRTTGTGGTFSAAAGTFTPAVGATTSTFTYTLTGVAPCINDSSVATVTINAQPVAGGDGSTIVCETGGAVNLFSLITGEQAGGVWTQNTGTGGTFNAAAGTYTPAVGATNATFTYTLTGVAPCINDSSLASITINPQPTAGTDGGTTICENNPAVINLFTLITGEQAGGTWTRTTGTGGTFNALAGTFTPAIGVTTSTFTYTVSGAAPCINDASIATVTINPLPTATISGTASVCVGTTSLPGITFTGSNGTPPYTFFYTLNTVPDQAMTTSTSSSALVTIPSSSSATIYTYDLVGVSDSSSTTCSQNQSGTATVTVVAPPVINTPTDYVVCDDSLNNDGVYCFTLTTKDAEVTSDPNVVVTYHETLTNSQTGANPLVSPYCNINHSGLMTIYVRAYTLGAPLCYSNTSFDLIVNPIPLPNPVITDYELCDYNNPGDGIEIFDLGTKSAEIANGQSNVTVSYYATPADAQSQTSPLANLYPNTANPQQIWINIKDTATGCNTTGSFNLVVNPLPFVTQPQTLFECSNGLVLTAIFDLTINEGVVTSNVTGLAVTYYHSLADAQTQTSAIPTPDTYLGADNEIVYIRVENISTGCYATTTQLLRVTQGPVAITPQPLQYCDPNNDGFGVFNLEDATNEIAGGVLPPGVSVTYHETADDAFIGANALTSPYYNIDPWTQTIFVRVFYTLTGCDNYVQLQLIVNPTPEATTPQPYELCDYTGATGYEAFNLNSVIPEILGTINPALTTVTFYTTLADAQNETFPINNPGNYTNGTINSQIIYVHVETTATGCFDIVELQLIVNPLPNSAQPNYPQYSLCDNNQANIGYETFDLGSKIDAILLGQTGMDVRFYISLGDAQNGTGEITNLMYTNQVQYVQTLGITITNHLTGCLVISTMDIRVEPLPVLIPPSAPYTLCDENQDGFTTFDLTTLLPGLLNGVTTYTVTFHETLADANNNGTSIPNPAAYINIHPFVQIIYARAEDNITHCVSVLPIVLNVDASPIAPIALDNITVCDNDSNPQDAITGVDLTQRTPDVLAQQPLAASNYTVTYYETLIKAQDGTAPIINNTNYPGYDGQMIWVRVENNNSNCFNIGSFELEINTPLLLTTPAPLSLCDDDASPNNQFHVFNLTVKNTEINQGTGYLVTYYPSLLDAQNNTNPISATDALAYQNVPAHPAVQTLGVVVTTPAGCTSITTLDIRVLPIPTPNTNPPALAPKCDDNNPGDMVEVFDLTVNEAYIKNGDNTLTLHYYYTQADADQPQNEIIPANAVSVGANVWIRVENTRVDFEGNHCYVLVEQALTVNPLPTVVQPLPPYRVCDDNADGIAQFDLTNPLLAPQILGATQLPADYTVSYYLSQANAASGTSPLPSPYTNVTPTSQNIYIRVVNNATGCVNATGMLTLAVEAYATATGPQTFTQCDSYADPYDGIDQVDLTQFETAILNGQNPAVFLVSYYRSLADATAGTNPLTPAEAAAYVMDSADTDTVWVKVENSSNTITPFCYALTTIEITIERYPNPIINTPNGMTTICVDYNTNAVIRPLTLDSGITNTTNYSFEWFENGSTTAIPGATGPTYTVSTADATGATRSYTVHVTSISALGCDTTSQSFDVIQSGPAVIPAGSLGYTISNAFSDSQTITVLIEGYGSYEYSLDDGPRQTGNIFEGVSFGGHVIHVWDSEGGVAYSCEQLIIYDVQIIDYPHYFTPNGDGIHDTWNIVGLQNQPAARIYIFDRYGKLLKQISSTGLGWDGTYNGHLLPADDYWFSVDYIENATAKQFKAHFTLKR